jgi:N-acetylglucosamine kinase-like BadF-type ATPase
MTWLVGVDAGASRTTAFVADESLQVAAEVTGAPGALAPGTAPAAAQAIVRTVRDALYAVSATQAGVLVIGAAGAGREAERAELERAVVAAHVAGRVQVTTDVEIALVAALGNEPGIVLLAGTGSGACARLLHGELLRIGGYGWQFGDEGSGYAIARAALAAVAQANDGRAPETTLLAALAPVAGVARSTQALISWARSAPRPAVADLAQVVQRLALAGDPVARTLVAHAAQDLVAHVRALMARFDGDAQVPVALAGGLLRSGQPVRKEVARLLAAELPRAHLIEALVQPARGALVLATRVP